MKTEVEGLLKTLDGLWRARTLSKKEMAEALNVPFETFRKWFGERRKEPSQKNLEKIKQYLASSLSDEDVCKESKERAERIEYLLLVLESELRHFRDGPKKVRDVLRAALDANDVGYISSLLSMLGEEDRFERWKVLTTNKFNSFKRKKGGAR